MNNIFNAPEMVGPRTEKSLEIERAMSQIYNQLTEAIYQAGIARRLAPPVRGRGIRGRKRNVCQLVAGKAW